jgi:hypothetical protein
VAINLDEQRAVRREAAGIHPTLTVGGREYDLPVELPVEAIRHLKSLAEATKKKDGDAITDALLGALEAMLGREFAEFMTNGPSIQDLAAVVSGIPAEYGMELGESSASPTPVKSTTARPRRRSAKATS